MGVKMGFWDPNAVVLRIEVPPASRKIVKIFWIGYITIVVLCLLVLVLL
jgi:hypothetical protein